MNWFFNFGNVKNQLLFYLFFYTFFMLTLLEEIHTIIITTSLVTFTIVYTSYSLILT